MLQIPRQQVLERWDSLPDNLREALVSPFNGDFIWRLGEKNHLSEEKISMIATTAGDVIFGFIRPEDLASELQETLEIDPRIANAISKEINQRIFFPLHNEIRKVYSPVSAMPEVKEIKPPIKPKPEVEFPKIELPKEEVEVPKIEKEIEIKKKPEFEPKPIEITDKPFVIYQEAEAKPVAEKQPGFPQTGWFKKEKPKMPEVPIKVKLEMFGQKIEEKKEPTIAKTEAPKQKVIHYREVEAPTPFGKPPTEEKKAEPVVDLSSFKVIKEEKEGEKEVKINGNTIDLK